MEWTGNTIFITGGGTGIGRGLAEALHQRGNKVIISGRRRSVLDETTKANPGIDSLELDVADPASIATVAQQLIARYPALNVLINNAGIMKSDGVEKQVDDAVVESTVAINLLGPIRLTSALIEHLKQQKSAAVINVTSGLAFTPLASSATYSATKAALHSYTLSQRYLLQGSAVKMIELAPPYVQTELTSKEQAKDPKGMPLAEFIAEAMQLLETDVDEVLVERVRKQRNNAGPHEAAFLYEFNRLRSGN